MYGQIYISRTGDREIIENYIEYFRKMEDAQLLEESVNKKKLGIFGVHQQGLNLIAFNIVMLERFNDSPIEIEGNCLIKFKDETENSIKQINKSNMENFKEAYEGTKFMVFNPTLVIEVNKKCHELDELLKQHNASEWAYITAWNPLSEVLTDAENSQRHQQLIELVKEYQYFEGEGVGTDPAWNPEKSLLILGITKEKAIEIGTKFKQNAIVYGSINEPAELLHLFDF